MAAVGLGGFSFAIAIVWQPAPIYAATSKVEINSQQSLGSIYLEAITYNSGDEIETQEAVITSNKVLQRAGEELGLFPNAGSSEDTTRIVLNLKDRVETSPEGYTNIISITTTGQTAGQARQLASVLAVA